MRHDTPVSQKQDFNAALNGYRGFCALLVFLFHLGSAGVVSWPRGTLIKDAAAHLWTSLAYGVEMFFMISGFVILGSLLRHSTLRGFLQDRFIRIYSAWVPALVAVTTVCMVLKMKMFTGTSAWEGLGIFAGNLLLLPPLLPLPLVHQGSWSLSYEWVFYISAAIGAWLLRGKRPPTWAVAAWAIFSGLFVCLYPRSLFFSTGVIVFACQPWFRRRERWLKFPLLSLLVFLVAWHLTGADKAELSATVFDWLRNGRWAAATVAFAASLHMFASITLNTSRQFAFLGSRAFQWLGTISYSFYLWHALVMSATKRLANLYVVPQFGVAAGFGFFLISSITAGLLVSWASWALFEAKFAKFLRKTWVRNSPSRGPFVTPELASRSGSIGHRKRCLWIARYVPYPLDAGAKVYSAMLADSLAESGVFVRFIGFGDTHAVPDRAARVEWLAVPGKKRGRSLAACSSLPIAAASDATNAYRLLVDAQLRERWDAIVLDGYGTGWALHRCLAYRDASRPHRPVLVHVSHNHEELLWRALAREARGSALKRYTLRRNSSKVSALERRIVRNVDLVTTITDEDRRSLGTGLDPDRMLTLSPGYVGWVASERRITAATPRRVIIMGSFQWVVKQENLAGFVEIADPIFHEHGIALDIVGDVPRELLCRLQKRCRSTCFHGFAADVAPFLARARIGVVPESIGGGFKLKFLDYIFGRVPVATVSQAAAGLPEELRRTMLSSGSFAELVETIVSHMDRLDTLNRMQEGAFTLAKAGFNWSTRGEQFRQALSDVQQQLTPMKGQSMDDSERIRREREYHNHRFADDSARESRVGRFYSAIRYGFDLYRRRVSDEARGRRVLEYGCGTGSLAFALAGQAGHVIGIDISDVAIQQAQRASGFRGLKNVEFAVDNAEAMRLPEKHVDVVAGSGIVHHLDIPKSMSEVRRVLRGEGIAIFAEPMAHNPVLNWYRSRTPELRSADEHPLTVEDLRGMALGFASTKFTYFGLVAPLLGLFSTEAKADSWTTRFTWWLDRLLCSVPGLNRLAWYCLIELRNG